MAKMLNYYEMYGKYYNHLTPDDLRTEEWRYAVIDGETSDRYIVSSCGRFADLKPKRTHRDFGRQYEAPGFGRAQMINVSIHRGSHYSKKNAADGYLQVWLNEKNSWTHVVVASTFIRPLVGDETVDHILEKNAYDNRAKNLQILSGQDNNLKGKIVRSYETQFPVGVSWDTYTCKWKVYANYDVFGTKHHVARFDRLEPAAVCAATIFRRYRRCDNEKIRKMLLQSYADLADYTLTDAEQADVDAKIAAFEDRNADIIKGIGVLADA